MKKLLYIMLFLIFAMNLTAQSVWDGKREAIRSGSGTESDPYLIENAQQLAWLAYVVNWDYSIWTKDKFFLLTTDIDLGGNADNQWIPIGAGPSTDSHKLFDGVFDGGFHSITGIYIDADNAVNADGTPNTAHSLNPVPAIYVTPRKDARIENGILADVAPSILTIMGLPIPAEMTGKVLVK